MLEELSPSIQLKLHHMDVKSLNKAFRDNDKQIEKVLGQYQGRYTTKANQAIYDLMVIALRAELQNVLYNLKYDKLDNGIQQVQDITKKYLEIASQGNQSIAGTLTKFIGEIEYLFINSVKIEYNYYVKKEQARQELIKLFYQYNADCEKRGGYFKITFENSWMHCHNSKNPDFVYIKPYADKLNKLLASKK